jgi:hypothetical protein
MSRRRPSSDAVTAVLLKSRRRCCICFGLNRDTTIKSGQVAHLDGDPAHSVEDNLAFLCFDHHDRLDSRTSQSKNFTIEEVKGFRAELYEAIKLAFDGEVSFGAAPGRSRDRISGHYIREGQYESADIQIQRLKDGRYHVKGIALFGTERPLGPNIGELEFIGSVRDNALEYRSIWNNQLYRALLRFGERHLVVSEEGQSGTCGMSVTFSGEYVKAN